MKPVETRISALLVLAICTVVGVTYWLAMKNQPQTTWLLLRGALLVATAAFCLSIGLAALHRQFVVNRRNLIDGACQWVLAGGSGTMAPADPDIKSMVTPLRQKIEELSAKADSLQIAKKNLEIQLRLADAQRRQSETMIHGISDAVLVTDAFD